MNPCKTCTGTQRNKEGKCIECARRRNRESYRKNREYYISKVQERNRKIKENDPMRHQVIQEYRREYAKKRRQAFLSQGLTTKKTERTKILPYQLAIKNAGKFPNVMELVRKEQDLFSAQENKKEEKRKARKLRYLTDLNFRYYTREKSKRRKAKIKGNTIQKVSVSEIKERFLYFENKCAYCGEKRDLQIEHFWPISKGGAHSLSNIIPACSRCNYSKRDKNPKEWYKKTPFFNQGKWDTIVSILASS